jgi:hypothetical protein
MKSLQHYKVTEKLTTLSAQAWFLPHTSDLDIQNIVQKLQP